jgi:hypothetical protein
VPLGHGPGPPHQPRPRSRLPRWRRPGAWAPRTLAQAGELEPDQAPFQLAVDRDPVVGWSVGSDSALEAAGDQLVPSGDRSGVRVVTAALNGQGKGTDPL